MIDPVVRATVERINKNVAKRNAYLKEWATEKVPTCTHHRGYR